MKTYQRTPMDQMLRDIKDIIVELAIDDELPLDMSELDTEVFTPAVNKFIERLKEYEVVFDPEENTGDETVYGEPMIPLYTIKP